MVLTGIVFAPAFCMSHLRIAAAVVATMVTAADASAYSVLAHEANIDALWDAGIRPILQQRFPHASRQDLQNARAYAYGGSVIQDIGYYPFGNHFFSNLMHYVRSGDFVEALLRDSRSVDELAFALGALAHYASDNTGHPEAVNRAVPLLFPKLRKKYGDRVTYAQSPASHVITEFSFDIVQAAAGGYLPDAYHAFIGFQVSKPVLERAFEDTYGLEVADVLQDEDLAISTYRHAVSELIPELTRAAWHDKKDEIERLMPNVNANTFIFSYTRAQYDREFGPSYRRPGLLMRILAFLFRLLPKIGPLRPLSFKAPTPQAEAFFTQSLTDTRVRYRRALEAVRERRERFANTDFDTGQESRYGEYSLSDDTYRELLKRLDRRKFEHVPPSLRTNIDRYYAGLDHAPLTTRKERKHAREVRDRLARLNSRIE
jgi:hypothetical protein